jgi:hypothetical protein
MVLLDFHRTAQDADSAHILHRLPIERARSLREVNTKQRVGIGAVSDERNHCLTRLAERSRSHSLYWSPSGWGRLAWKYIRGAPFGLIGSEDAPSAGIHITKPSAASRPAEREDRGQREPDQSQDGIVPSIIDSPPAGALWKCSANLNEEASIARFLCAKKRSIENAVSVIRHWEVTVTRIDLRRGENIPIGFPFTFAATRRAGAQEASASRKAARSSRCWDAKSTRKRHRFLLEWASCGV